MLVDPYNPADWAIWIWFSRLELHGRNLSCHWLYKLTDFPLVNLIIQVVPQVNESHCRWSFDSRSYLIFRIVISETSVGSPSDVIIRFVQLTRNDSRLLIRNWDNLPSSGGTLRFHSPTRIEFIRIKYVLHLSIPNQKSWQYIPNMYLCITILNYLRFRPLFKRRLK